MLCSQVQVLLVAVLSSALLVHASASPRRDTPREDDEDLARLLLLKFVSELMAAGGDEMLPEPREDRDVVGVRAEEVMRRHLPLSQRERKAGCRNFFWKTFTSC